ncbi:L,D-transpeptidase family protein [Thalassotalea ponticola]|uniref:L,D-transpeptidase family protein n=1 Tax=Thalassotalea ponticola TaxID=1523392 RepID=UPI0025B49CF5|nr:L,D-transpeptidase family protein [Thalassotalea ponticola]MDN3652025.1 L,D-transpeptidase family protein [Thalassotalea ponticola]
MNKISYSLIGFCLLFINLTSEALEFDLPEGKSRLVGEITHYTVQQGDYFQKIAEQFHVGFLALMEANPGVDPMRPEPGSELVIPTQMILPYGNNEGIVINLSELRLYFFDQQKQKVHVFPVGIGKIGHMTPTLIDKITEKRTNPNWFPTADHRKEYLAKHGVEMPRMIPAGPNNPLGDYAMRIGTSAYLIHGTNQRFGIGMRASAGCIRMYPQDIEWLFKNSPPGTPVKIIDSPIKMTYHDQQTRIVEVHSPLTDDNGEVPSLLPLSDGVKKFIGDSPNHLQQIEQLIMNPTGVPVQIRSPAPM